MKEFFTNFEFTDPYFLASLLLIPFLAIWLYKTWKHQAARLQLLEPLTSETELDVVGNSSLPPQPAQTD